MIRNRRLVKLSIKPALFGGENVKYCVLQEGQLRIYPLQTTTHLPFWKEEAKVMGFYF